MDTPIWPASTLITVVPHASTNFTALVRQVYVGGSGDVVVVLQDDTVRTFKNVNAGSTIGPFYIKRINAIGTTATDMLAFA